MVSARELSLKEIRDIREQIPEELEIETFIHGAMCISYSGRCLLSNYLTGRDANQGECTHPCRWKYVPELIEAGIDSFKIEGRMKTALYVATVARTYRRAIDDFMKSRELYEKNMPWYKSQISNCTYRQFTTGFFFGKPSEEAQIYDNNTYLKEYTYLGIVEDFKEGLCQIRQRNKFSVGEMIEVMKPDGENESVTVLKILDEEGKELESAPHPKQKLFLDLGTTLSQYDILRRKEEEC